MTSLTHDIKDKLKHLNVFEKIMALNVLVFFIGKDISPQLYIAPRGLITVLLFYAIPEGAIVAGFEAGILLFIIIGTSLIMTFAMIADKKRTGEAVRKATNNPIGYERWKAPTIDSIEEKS